MAISSFLVKWARPGPFCRERERKKKTKRKKEKDIQIEKDL